MGGINMLHFLRKVLLCLALACSLGVSYASGIATTGSVFLRAEPGNYVGFGLPAGGATWLHGIDVVFIGLNTSDGSAKIIASGDESWTFQFAAPQLLQVGYYGNAVRYPSNSPLLPGMDVSGGSRGFNQLSGWFNVLQVSYDSAQQISALAIDFAEYGENLTQSGPALFGSLRYNSSVPLTTNVPEPSTLIQLCAGLFGLFVLRGRCGASPARRLLG
jgi:hypothetical protein